MGINNLEKQLVKRCLSGDESAWRELYKKYHRFVRAIVCSPAWDFIPSKQEDLVQEVFLRLIRGLRQFQFKSSLKTFIGRITKNTCISELRKSMVASLLNLSDADCAVSTKIDGPERDLVKKQERTYLFLAFRKLDERCRKLIRRFYLEGGSYKEISRALEMSVTNVGVSLGRCLVKLRGLYRKLTGEKG